MQINLRKANAIQQDIKGAIRALSVPLSISVTEFENGEQAIADAKEKAAEARKDFDALTGALYEIRRKVGAKNGECGINGKLADVAETEDRISLLRSMVKPDAQRLEPEVLLGKLEKLAKTPKESTMPRYGVVREDEVTTGIYSAEEIAGFQAEIAALRRAKRELQEDLLGLNVANKISLSEDSVATLTNAGIV